MEWAEARAVAVHSSGEPVKVREITCRPLADGSGYELLFDGKRVVPVPGEELVIVWNEPQDAPTALTLSGGDAITNRP